MQQQAEVAYHFQSGYVGTLPLDVFDRHQNLSVTMDNFIFHIMFTRITVFDNFLLHSPLYRNIVSEQSVDDDLFTAVNKADIGLGIISKILNKEVLIRTS